MFIECARCPVRGRACETCMVTALFNTAPEKAATVPLDRTERRAVDIFVGAGLVRPEDTAGLCARIEPWEGPARTVCAVG